MELEEEENNKYAGSDGMMANRNSIFLVKDQKWQNDTFVPERERELVRLFECKRKPRTYNVFNVLVCSLAARLQP